MNKTTRIVLLTLIAGYFTAAVAQQYTLRGVVHLLNSETFSGKRQYVKGAEIWGDKSTVGTSDDLGKFGITFSGVEGNKRVKISVLKEGYEVSDASDLFPIINQAEPIAVFMEKTTVLRRRIDTMVANSYAAAKRNHLLELQRLRAQGKSAEAAEKAYRELRNRIPGMVKDLVYVNLDDANRFYKKAYRQFSEGDLEGAQKTLGDAKIDEKVRIAKKQKTAGEALTADAKKALAEYVNMYVLDGNVYTLKLQFEQALAVYQKADSITDRAENPRKWAEVKLLKGNTHANLGIRVEGAASRHLTAAVAACRRALEVFTRDRKSVV